MFIGRDPDPNAVDEGRIIGVRIEVFNRRTFFGLVLSCAEVEVTLTSLNSP